LWCFFLVLGVVCGLFLFGGGGVGVFKEVRQK